MPGLCAWLDERSECLGCVPGLCAQTVCLARLSLAACCCGEERLECYCKAGFPAPHPCYVRSDFVARGVRLRLACLSLASFNSVISVTPATVATLPPLPHARVHTAHPANYILLPPSATHRRSALRTAACPPLFFQQTRFVRASPLSVHSSFRSYRTFAMASSVRPPSGMGYAPNRLLNNAI